MPINDGNNITVDTLAAAIAAAQAKVGGAPAPVAQKTSKLKERLDAMEAHPDSDKETVAALKNLFADFEVDMSQAVTEKQREELTRALVAQRDQYTINIIKLSLADYIADDAFLKEYEDVLTDKVIKEFNGNKEFERAREKYSNGDVDLALLKQLALNEVTKFNKARGKDPVKATGSAGMRKDSQESKHIATESESGGGRDSDGIQILNRSELNAKERSLYDARIGTAQRVGHKADSEAAKKLASQAVLKMRKANLGKSA